MPSGEMPDYPDLLGNAGRACPAQLRIYLQSERPPDLTALAAHLPEYEPVAARHNDEDPYRVTLIRKIEFDAEQLFRAECTRVATLLELLLDSPALIECLFDRSDGSTVFSFRLRKGQGTGFSEEILSEPEGSPPL
jgi:hypothetical protein